MSSTVWWPSTRGRRWPARRGRSRRGDRAGRACGRRTGARSSVRPRPCRRRGRARRRCSVSLVVRATLRSGRRGGLDVAQDLLQGGEERVVLGGGADGDAEAAVEAGPRRAVADEHRAVDQRLPHGVARRRAAGRNSTKLAPDGHTVDGQVGQAGDEPAALLDQRRDPGVHLVDVVEGEAAGQLLERRRGGTAARPCRARRPPRPGRPGSRGGRRPSTTSWRRCG